MVARNADLPLCLRADVQCPQNTLDVTAAKSEDGKTLTLQVVNISKAPVAALVTLQGFTPRRPTAQTVTLSGDWEAINTPEHPDHIKPVRGQWRHELKNGAASCEFPAWSFTVLRVE